ncbi:MAG TPA: hypothetical protein VHM19_17630, partial [Polyangiales bacterium]|nr:hypothetical protein [Polyangiales bacterium]
SDSGPRACAPITWGCTDYGYGKIVCDPGGTMGVAGKGDPGMSAGGSAANSCDDGNACTYDGVLEDGTCYHKPSAGMGTDADSDGAPEGCDCEEHEANAFPGQTEYFSQPYKVTTVRMDSKPVYQLGDPAFDYDCNGWEELQYTAISSTCKSWENQPICLGEGWVVDPATKQIPVCGSGGAYQVCAWDANKNACLATTIMLLQGCR